MTSEISIASWLEHASHLRYVVGFQPTSAVVVSHIAAGKLVAVACSTVAAPTQASSQRAFQRCVARMDVPADGYGIVTVWASADPEVPTLLGGVRDAWQHRNLTWGGVIVGDRFQREPGEEWTNLAAVDTSLWVGQGVAVQPSRQARCTMLDDDSLVPAGGVATTVRLWARSRAHHRAEERALRFRCVAHTPETELGSHAALLTRALQDNATVAYESARVLGTLPTLRGVLCCLCDDSAEELSVQHYRWLVEGYLCRVPVALRPRWWFLLALVAYRCGDGVVAREASQRARRDPTVKSAARVVGAAIERGERLSGGEMAKEIDAALRAGANARLVRQRRGASVHRRSAQHYPNHRPAAG